MHGLHVGPVSNVNVNPNQFHIMDALELVAGHERD